jgi:hypothetical protein
MGQGFRFEIRVGPVSEEAFSLKGVSPYYNRRESEKPPEMSEILNAIPMLIEVS